MHRKEGMPLSEISRTMTVVAAPDQVSSDLAGESVILNLKTGLYYGLNEVGASIWNCIQSPTTVDEICNTIMGQYDVSPEDCEQDVFALLQEMMSAKLIEIQS